MQISIENTTTIATFLYVLVAPILVKYCNFNLDESTFVAIIGFIIAFISARNPNTIKLLGNDTVGETTEEELNTEAIIDDEGA